MELPTAWMRPSWRTFLDSARASLLAPAASAADIVLRTVLFVTLIGGAIVWPGPRTAPGPCTA